MTMPASAGASVMSSAPEAIVPSGSRPNASHSARPSGSTVMRSRSMRSPTPAAVGQLEQRGGDAALGRVVHGVHAWPARRRSRPPGSTLMPGRAQEALGAADHRRRHAARAQLGLLLARDDRRALERHALGQHDGVARPARRRSSPAGPWPPRPAWCRPRSGRSRPCVTSVWPPTSATSSSSHASASWAKSAADRVLVGLRRSGSSSVARNQRGRAPRTAMSLALTCSAYQPSSSVANVMGSAVGDEIAVADVDDGGVLADPRPHDHAGIAATRACRGRPAAARPGACRLAGTASRPVVYRRPAPGSPARSQPADAGSGESFRRSAVRS